MELLYCFETTIEFQGSDTNQLFQRWLAIVEEFIAYATKTTGVAIKQLWKICGENKMIGVLSVTSPGQLDICMTQLLKQQTADVKITTEVTPLRPYEDFAGTMAVRAREHLITNPITPVPLREDGVYYFLWSRVEYMGMSQQDLLKNWAEEARFDLEAKKVGSILDWWKVVSERKVWVIIHANNPGDMDELGTFDLPMLKKMGAQVYIDCKSIRPIKYWIEDLKKLVNE
ncbi:hypothetical protein OS493_005464 [Desmophyllum pertusum]|uniref:Uncharacterized protein n=1 Tax=Desmophyllum pertusum TaxID=174260 RepID=A0A9W9YSD9_9CNID|nr:hypothetical protein OS493_005464 [Desmophyllum pertusum]